MNLFFDLSSAEFLDAEVDLAADSTDSGRPDTHSGASAVTLVGADSLLAVFD